MEEKISKRIIMNCEKIGCKDCQYKCTSECVSELQNKYNNNKETI